MVVSQCTHRARKEHHKDFTSCGMSVMVFAGHVQFLQRLPSFQGMHRNAGVMTGFRASTRCCASTSKGSQPASAMGYV